MRIKRRCYIGLGSNIAPRLHYLEAAMQLLERVGDFAAVSSTYESPPWQGQGRGAYLNRVVALNTALAPHALMKHLLAIERALGRDRTRGIDRTIDLDLIDYAGMVLESPTLHLPHPRMHQRAFVLLPLHEIAPRWRHPRSHRSIRALLADLPAEERASTVRIE